MRRLSLLLSLAGCPGCETPPPACTTTTLDTMCLPQYQPTFANVYANTISVDCGSTNGSCHGAGGESGLSFADMPTAYQSLVEHVAPEPECSELIVRTHDLGEDYSMPPGDPLGASERCALLQWVIAGTPP